ncbi:MAG: hypothetical protein ACXVX9_12895 [Mycobacteriaceae bacterium]
MSPFSVRVCGVVVDSPEVVEVFDQLRVGLLQRRDPTWEQLVVVPLCVLTNRRGTGPAAGRAPGVTG